MKLRALSLATPFLLAAGLGSSGAATADPGTALTPVRIDTAAVAPSADGTLDAPGVVSAVVLPSAANQVRLGSVRLNGVAILDAASLDCTGAHPALLLAPTAGVVLPSVPSVGTVVDVPGVGPLTLDGEQAGNGVADVTGISASVNGHTVGLLNGTCTAATPGSNAPAKPADSSGTGAGTIGVEVSVTGAPEATPSASAAGAPHAAIPTSSAPATLPPRTPPLPGEAAAPSPVPGAGGVTG